MTAQPILVTGAHRTGTTWVGKMLAGNRYAYISEPLNCHHRRGIFSARVNCWYQYITRDNQDDFLPAYRDLLRLRYRLWVELRSLRSRKDVGRMLRDLSIFTRGKILRQPLLIKDPFAVFSLPWFIDRLGFRVVVTMRHPAAFASSLKRLNWPFNFGNLLCQPLLMEDHLEPYRAAMQAMREHDYIGQGALLWRLIYTTVEKYRADYPEIVMVRHEDLSLNPLEQYRALYADLDLPFTSKDARRIERSSSSDNPDELTHGKTHSVHLNSRANLFNWKKRLYTEEIERIQNLCGDLLTRWYADVEL